MPIIFCGFKKPYIGIQTLNMYLLLKKQFVFIAVIMLAAKAKAQTPNTDSLWRVFETTQNDSLRLLALTTLQNHYIRIEIDSNVYYAKRLIQVCNKFNIPRYNALGILYASFLNYRLGEYVKVQENIIKAAAYAEKNNDEEVMARIENFRNFLEPDPIKKIEHLRKAIFYKKALIGNDQLSTIFLGNISGAFLNANQVDSAFFYAQKMYTVAINRHDTLSSYITSTMGNVYMKMNQPDIAYAFYRKGLKAANQTKKIQDLMGAYMSLGNYFSNINQQDSALFYWQKPFEFGPKESYGTKLTASKKIYAYYYAKGNNDSAAKYMNYFIIANDSINSTNKIAQLQTAKFEDELNQQELAKTLKEEQESRNHNIQLAITAIGILTAIILFLLLSRSILVSHKVVAFLSVLILLVVFEFINLLIHPFLEKITHHSPVLMLLGLVALAALIIPLHHKLEHWATHKLVEKNKAIRLAKAKKTIEELEEKNTDNTNPTTI